MLLLNNADTCCTELAEVLLLLASGSAIGWEEGEKITKCKQRLNSEQAKEIQSYYRSLKRLNKDHLLKNCNNTCLCNVIKGTVPAKDTFVPANYKLNHKTSSCYSESTYFFSPWKSTLA